MLWPVMATIKLLIEERCPSGFVRNRDSGSRQAKHRKTAYSPALRQGFFLCLLVRLDPGREPPKRSAADKKWIDPLPRREQQERRRLGGSYRHVEVDIASPYSRCRPDLKT